MGQSVCSEERSCPLPGRDAEGRAISRSSTGSECREEGEALRSSGPEVPPAGLFSPMTRKMLSHPLACLTLQQPRSREGATVHSKQPRDPGWQRLSHSQEFSFVGDGGGKGGVQSQCCAPQDRPLS